jgi:hypothetical protein
MSFLKLWLVFSRCSFRHALNQICRGLHMAFSHPTVKYWRAQNLQLNQNLNYYLFIIFTQLHATLKNRGVILYLQSKVHKNECDLMISQKTDTQQLWNIWNTCIYNCINVNIFSKSNNEIFVTVTVILAHKLTNSLFLWNSSSLQVLFIEIHMNPPSECLHHHLTKENDTGSRNILILIQEFQPMPQLPDVTQSVDAQWYCTVFVEKWHNVC